MATICRNCLSKKDGVSMPPVRTAAGPCDQCGGYDALINQKTGAVIKKFDRNYDYPDELLPGNPNEPNAVAEREKEQNGV